MLIYIIAGLTTGSVFGLAAVGVVLTYKTTGIFNFAHGALASAAAFLFYFLNVQHRVPAAVAAITCILVAGPVFGLVLEFMARRLEKCDLLLKVVATIGVLLIIEGGLDLLYPPGPDREVPQFLPTATFTVGSTPIQAYRVIIFAVGLIAMVVLTIFLRRSGRGVAMRGVVDDPDLLDITGTSPTRIRRYSWLIGATTATTAGVLLAPLLPLDATTLTLLIITAFGAAAIGAFHNLPLTYLGGLAIGIAQALLQKYIVNANSLLAGLSASLPFILLFGLLIASPKLRRPSTARIVARARAPMWRPPLALRAGSLSILTAVLLVAPEFVGIHLVDWTRFVAYIIVFLSLGVLVRTSGQVSLAHVSFMAIGVCSFSQLAAVHHWPWLAAIVVAGLIAAPIGAVLAIPAIRFPGLYLALATLGFGILLQQMFYKQTYMFGPFGLGTKVPVPHVPWLGLVGDKGYYYVVLVVALLITVLILALNSSRLGRLLRSMGDSPVGLASCGASINVSRVIVFSVTAALAAIAGVLDAGALHIVGSDGYDPLLSLQLFAVVVITVGEAPWYAIVAAAAQVLIPAYIGLSATVGYALTLLFGAGAVVFAVTPPSSRRLPERARRVIDRAMTFTGRPALGSNRTAAQAATDCSTQLAVTQGATHELRVEQISVRYGGLIAADGITLSATTGRVTGLIGPNGAGKTTVFNACTGTVRASSGHVYLNWRSLDRLGPPRRARLGLGRTFQHMELFDSLTVSENVALGCEARFAGANPVDHLISRAGQRAEIRKRTEQALRLCGLTDLSDEVVGDLSTGQRRLVELARCLSGDFAVMLLDEPSSGLDQAETQRLCDILHRVVSERHVAILLIEHDMALVNRLCDHVYVMDFGRYLFDGSTEEIRSSEAVRSAYLGDLGNPGEVSVRSDRKPRSSAGPATAATAATPATSGPLLSFRNVRSGYGTATVLRDVSFQVHAGQVMALLGSNGAGKTTLLRTACGILRPTSGTVELDGEDVTSRPPHERTVSGLCVIPEGRGIFRTLTVLENLRLQVAADEKHPKDALERAFAMFPLLRARTNQLAGTLSGGQQQMLSLARAYVTRPKIILADEVSMGLAPIAVDEMFEAMHDLASTGIAMLLVEQYVTRALKMADSVMLINKGTISFTGSASALDHAEILRGYLGLETVGTTRQEHPSA